MDIKINNITIFIIEFFAGIGLSLVIKKYNYKPQYPIFTYLGIFIITLFLLGLNMKNILNEKSDIIHIIDMGLLSILGIAPLLWGLINEDTFIRKILSLPLFITLGKASYIFYLIHKGFIPIFINDYIWENKFFIFVVLNLISILLFKYIEEPANLWIRRNFGKI